MSLIGLRPGRVLPLFVSDRGLVLLDDPPHRSCRILKFLTTWTMLAPRGGHFCDRQLFLPLWFSTIKEMMVTLLSEHFPYSYPRGWKKKKLPCPGLIPELGKGRFRRNVERVRLKVKHSLFLLCIQDHLRLLPMMVNRIERRMLKLR